MPKPLGLITSFGRHIRQDGLQSALLGVFDYVGLGGDFQFLYPLNGGRFKVMKGNRFFWKRLIDGKWEINSIQYITGIVEKGQTIMDIGAWIGPYTLFFAEKLQDTGRVYAFEPDTKARKALNYNLKKNKLGNVIIEKYAVSNINGECELQAKGSWASSESNIIGRFTEKHVPSIMVPTITIDTFCAKRGILPHGFKIDVEGAEALVIEGAQAVIRECLPWALLEFHGHFMSPEKRIKDWEAITAMAKKVVFIDGNSRYLTYGTEVKSMPDCPSCHVFIQY